jgi:hypothetical protein
MKITAPCCLCFKMGPNIGSWCMTKFATVAHSAEGAKIIHLGQFISILETVQITNQGTSWELRAKSLRQKNLSYCPFKGKSQQISYFIVFGYLILNQFIIYNLL